MSNLSDLDRMILDGKAPSWLTQEGLKTLQGGYLLPKESPVDMYRRVAKAASSALKMPELEEDFFDIIWNNWLCLATPIACNLGTERGLPISCNSIHVGDSIDSIFTKSHELAMLSKYGAGVGIYLGDIRGRGASIKGNGSSEGIVPWAKVFDSTTVSVSQGSTRRGASAVYLPVEHSDFEEFINIRKPTGDINRRCLNLHHGVCISNDFMEKVKSGDKDARSKWTEIIKNRFETGEPYLFFNDNVNSQRPECYVKNNLEIKTSNICNEIYLYTDADHTFVCCLSSLNLVRYFEWKNWRSVSGRSLPELTAFFLDGVLTEYIEKAKNVRGLESAVRFAKKSRAIGIGVLGWHTFLQENNLPFDDFRSMMFNNEIFKFIREEADKATAEMARLFGEPEWCKGFNRRNSHCIAVAPTVSNSIISGSVSAGIEPIAANVFVLKSAKGTFLRKNKTLEKLLQTKGKNNHETWNLISQNDGSVLHLPFLSDEEKQVFLTAREINQFAIIKQAAQRQKYIDQGQSVNLFFAKNSDPSYIHKVHMQAWESGLKGLYYCRAESVIKGDMANRQKEECAACQA